MNGENEFFIRNSVVFSLGCCHCCNLVTKLTFVKLLHDSSLEVQHNAPFWSLWRLFSFHKVTSCVDHHPSSALFQVPRPTLVSKLMRNFAAGWKRGPGWDHRNTPPPKCELTLIVYYGVCSISMADAPPCPHWRHFSTAKISVTSLLVLLVASLWSDNNRVMSLR